MFSFGIILLEMILEEDIHEIYNLKDFSINKSKLIDLQINFFRVTNDSIL